MVENRRNATVEGFKMANKMVSLHNIMLLYYLTTLTAEIFFVFIYSDITKM